MNKGKAGLKVGTKRGPAIQWEHLKFEYFKEDNITIQDFIKSKDLNWNGNTLNKTNSWLKEKKSYLKSMVDKSKKKIEKKYEKEIDSLTSKLLKAKDKGITDLIETLNNNKDISVKDRLEILKFFKLELGETGVITENRDTGFKIIIK